ncbi:MAG: phosphodiester glycosidase family protein [Hydrogenophaga sp.]|nr:phosphodiester glycosidase family protein [Hydrogenophaga sp.]
MRLIFITLFLLLVALPAAAAKAEDTCSALQHGGISYTVCTVDPARSLMRIYHRDPQGRPFGSFDSLARQLWKERHYPIVAMNGGMYHDDLSAVGLFVEHGFERQAISTKAGWGNFHLLPNGVFWLKGGRAGVTETGRYLNDGIAAGYATQSGPMLVIDGQIHPRFLPDSDSLKIRNGVGVDQAGRVHMVISETPVRFYDFALLFRDVLGCRNALYLDGTISSLYDAGTGRRDRLFPLGPIIAVIGTVPQ